MKILFLNPPFLPHYSRSQRSPAVTKSGTLYFPIWLAYAAGLLEKNGFKIKLLDCPAENINHKEALRIIKEFSPKLIVLDTSTPSIYNDITIGEEIKNRLECFVLLVGSHVSTLSEETLKLIKSIDAIAKGEYDFTVLEIAKEIKNKNLNLEKIHGISYKKDGRIIHNQQREYIKDLDQLPMVSAIYKKHLNIRNYFFAASLYPEVQILTSRGCPFHCFFCNWPQTFQGRTYRTRSPNNVVDEFIYIKKHIPEAKGVVIEDDTFSVDKNRVHQICHLLIEKKVKLKWNANVRTDLDFFTMKLMKEAGCYLLIVGIESTDQGILDGMNKGLKAENIQTFFDNTKRLGLLVHAAFMAGNPGETILSLKNNLRIAKKLLPDTIQFFPLMPYPGTAAYEWAKKNGYLKINSFRDYLNSDGLHNCVIELPGLSSNDIIKWCNKSRNEYYLSPKYLISKFHKIIFKPRELIRTYKAFLNFKKHLFVK
jgi:radical SAM superfamily enzyme YgiQ (UPF0313 family)